MRTVDGERRDDHVYAGSVGETGVHHGRGFVHPPPDRGYDLVDNVHQVGIILETDIGFFQHARTLDVDLLGAVDQDVTDGRILKQWFQWAQAEDFVQDLKRKAFFLR